MEAKDYREYEKQIDGTWVKQHPETSVDNIEGGGAAITFGRTTNKITETAIADIPYEKALTGTFAMDSTLADLNGSGFPVIRKPGQYLVVANTHLYKTIAPVNGMTGRLELKINNQPVGFSAPIGGSQMTAAAQLSALLILKGNDELRLSYTFEGVDFNIGSQSKLQLLYLSAR